MQACPHKSRCAAIAIIQPEAEGKPDTGRVEACHALRTERAPCALGVCHGRAGSSEFS